MSQVPGRCLFASYFAQKRILELSDKEPGTNHEQDHTSTGLYTPRACVPIPQSLCPCVSGPFFSAKSFDESNLSLSALFAGFCSAPGAATSLE
jgi:hypothetical protein